MCKLSWFPASVTIPNLLPPEGFVSSSVRFVAQETIIRLGRWGIKKKIKQKLLKPFEVCISKLMVESGRMEQEKTLQPSKNISKTLCYDLPPRLARRHDCRWLLGVRQGLVFNGLDFKPFLPKAPVLSYSMKFFELLCCFFANCICFKNTTLRKQVDIMNF